MCFNVIHRLGSVRNHKLWLRFTTWHDVRYLYSRSFSEVWKESSECVSISCPVEQCWRTDSVISLVSCKCLYWLENGTFHKQKKNSEGRVLFVWGTQSGWSQKSESIRRSQTLSDFNLQRCPYYYYLTSFSSPESQESCFHGYLCLVSFMLLITQWKPLFQRENLVCGNLWTKLVLKVD